LLVFNTIAVPQIDLVVFERETFAAKHRKRQKTPEGLRKDQRKGLFEAKK
jgi:hypothetical protein